MTRQAWCRASGLTSRQMPPKAISRIDPKRRFDVDLYFLFLSIARPLQLCPYQSQKVGSIVSFHSISWLLGRYDYIQWERDAERMKQRFLPLHGWQAQTYIGREHFYYYISAFSDTKHNFTVKPSTTIYRRYIREQLGPGLTQALLH